MSVCGVHWHLLFKAEALKADNTMLPKTTKKKDKYLLRPLPSLPRTDGSETVEPSRTSQSSQSVSLMERVISDGEKTTDVPGGRGGRPFAEHFPHELLDSF